MAIFGVTEATTRQLIAAVSPDGATDDDRFARAAWSGIAEPGDALAGAFIAEVGAVAALEAVLRRESAQQIIAEAGLDIDAVDLAAGLARWTPRALLEQTTVSLKQAARFGMKLLTPSDELWPARFNDLGAHAPIAVWVRGDVAKLATLERSIALVGARAATGYGEHLTMEISAALVDRGFTIVSGAAYGIDGMAHRAALASKGTTVAVLAGGLDRYYPSGHDALLTRITEEGVIVGELPPSSPPTRWRFLQRNRLLAAMTNATVVVEAGARSGSLNTAAHAQALGRPVGAVPGPVTSPASAGCHGLIRDGAVCVTDADQIAELAG